MRVWIDIANSPHVRLFDPVVKHMRDQGWTVFLTAREHAQTAELARSCWPEVAVIGGESPSNRLAKAAATLQRSQKLALAARSFKPDVAVSHGSYAQLLATAVLRIPAVTMMDYEYQPANHVSFRLASRVMVPDVFPSSQLRRFGARETKVRRYDGFKEELYLADFAPSGGILGSLGIDGSKVVVVLRPPPSGALYHQSDNSRFDRIVEACAGHADVEAILLARTKAQRSRYSGIGGLVLPDRAIEGLSLLASADVVVGAGGTMNREAALLGVPTYTLFAGRLAAVDEKLVNLGFMQDIRQNGALPTLEKRTSRQGNADEGRGRALLALIVTNVAEARSQRDGRSKRRRAPLGG